MKHAYLAFCLNPVSFLKGQLLFPYREGRQSASRAFLVKWATHGLRASIFTARFVMDLVTCVLWTYVLVDFCRQALSIVLAAFSGTGHPRGVGRTIEQPVEWDRSSASLAPDCMITGLESCLRCFR